MGVKKSASLHIVFWRLLLKMFICLAGAVVIPFVILSCMVSSGIVSSADFAEIQANEIAPIIAATPDLSAVQIPMGIEYALLDKNYRLISGTLDADELEQAVNYATTGKREENLNIQYLLVIRENEYVVLQYHVGSRYTIEWLNKHLPSPDILLILLIGINCSIVCVLLTAGFVKKIRRQLVPLFEATSEVAKQNLDFEVGHSSIQEFEEVLQSFSNMKDGLKTSLEQQWKAEQMQREQIAALAHDLKTPLTIIRGNADLISETELDEEQRLYAEYIIHSSEQMQEYMKALIDISRAAAGYQLRMEVLEVFDFLKQIEVQVDALCKTKNINLQFSINNFPEHITADKLLLERAIMNVVSNALDYSPQGSTLYIAVVGKTDSLELSVTDEGEGFSQEALLHAQEQFYMAERSRGTNLHFGVGLYITTSIMEQHNGSVVLENAAETGGAKVTLSIPGNTPMDRK